MAEDLTNLIPPGRRPVLSPAGELRTVAEKDLPTVLAEGFTIPDSNTVHSALVEKKYGDSEVRAGVEGILRGGTFGLSDLGFRAMGVSPEELRGRQEANPLAAGIGQVGGIAASSLLLPGGGLTGLVGKGAMRAGIAATEALAPGIAKTIAQGTLSGAMEGTAYGLGQTVSEGALGDPTLNAQKIWSNVGLGTLLGGALGGGVATLGAARRGGWLLGKYGRGAEVPPPPPSTLSGTIEGELKGASEGTATGTLEGRATTKASGPVKLEGTIDFGIPDEKIIERAAVLNPKTPLNQNDLDWLKANGTPDASGKPTIFQKIGTEEIPTLNNAAQGQVTMENKIGAGMKKLEDTNIVLDANKENILRDSDLTLSKRSYKKMIEDRISSLKSSGQSGDEIGQEAIRKLKTTLKAAEDLPDSMNAMQIKQRIDNIRTSRKIYTKGGGINDDLVSQTYWDLQHQLDDYLKDNIDGYRSLMEEYAPLVKLSEKMERQLGWDWEEAGSKLKSDWVDNRVVKPFQAELYGNKSGGFSTDAKNLREFGKFIGVDLDKAVKTNLVFGKINPENALGGQRGTWGARVAEGFEFLKHPQEIPGKVLQGVAKVALTGELPEFLTSLQAKEIQSILMGHTGSVHAGVAGRIAGSIKDAINSGSKLFKPNGALAQLMVPEGVTAAHFVMNHDDMGEAEHKIETLIALERAANDADRKIQRAVNGIFNKDPQGVKTDSKLTRFVKTPDRHSSEWEEIVKDLTDLTQRPDLLMQRLAQGIDGMETAVPGVASGMTMTAMRAVTFLQQKLSLPERKPLDGKFTPSSRDIVQAAKYLRVINNPYRALDELRIGNVSREIKDVLQNVFPELYEHLKSEVLSGIAAQKASGKIVPHNRRGALSFFLDQELSSGFTSANLQKNFLAMGPKPMPTPKGASAKHLTLPDRTQTPLQKVAAR